MQPDWLATGHAGVSLFMYLLYAHALGLLLMAPNADMIELVHMRERERDSLRPFSQPGL